MKNRGKNKKKQWRRLLKNFNSDLNVVDQSQTISTGGFVIAKKDKLKFKKGDKEFAKDHNDLRTAAYTGTKTAYRPGRASVFQISKDIWDEPANSSIKAVSTATEHPTTCVAGQSYNPSALDHQLLLRHVSQVEAKLQAKENVTKIKTRSYKKPKKLLLQKNLYKKSKPTPKQLAKQMHTDLNNIPKILKEIKNEKKEALLNKHRRDTLKMINSIEKIPKFPMSFQLPGEITTNLRKLKTDQSWMQEVEFKRNKLPRARKTLGLTKNTSSYVRRKQKQH